MTVYGAKVNCIDRSARRTAHPQEPILRCNGRADCRREQHWHSLSLALVPGTDELFSILKHLGISRVPAGRFLLCGLTSLMLLFAAVEAHTCNRRLQFEPVKRDWERRNGHSRFQSKSPMEVAWQSRRSTMQQNTEAQMADLLEWRQRLESTHKQLLDAMTELITNKNYSEAERILYFVDKHMLDLIEDMGGTVVRSG